MLTAFARPLRLTAFLTHTATTRPSFCCPSVMPADAKTLVNPVKPTPESQARAKKMYGYDCAMCHGANGNGKGDVVADLKVS